MVQVSKELQTPNQPAPLTVTAEQYWIIFVIIISSTFVKRDTQKARIQSHVYTSPTVSKLMAYL